MVNLNNLNTNEPTNPVNKQTSSSVSTSQERQAEITNAKITSVTKEKIKNPLIDPPPQTLKSAHQVRVFKENKEVDQGVLNIVVNLACDEMKKYEQNSPVSIFVKHYTTEIDELQRLDFFDATPRFKLLADVFISKPDKLDQLTSKLNEEIINNPKIGPALTYMNNLNEVVKNLIDSEGIITESCRSFFNEDRANVFHLLNILKNYETPKLTTLVRKLLTSDLGDHDNPFLKGQILRHYLSFDSTDIDHLLEEGTLSGETLIKSISLNVPGLMSQITSLLVNRRWFGSEKEHLLLSTLFKQGDEIKQLFWKEFFQHASKSSSHDYKDLNGKYNDGFIQKYKDQIDKQVLNTLLETNWDAENQYLLNQLLLDVLKAGKEKNEKEVQGILETSLINQILKINDGLESFDLKIISNRLSIIKELIQQGVVLTPPIPEALTKMVKNIELSLADRSFLKNYNPDNERKLARVGEEPRLVADGKEFLSEADLQKQTTQFSSINDRINRNLTSIKNSVENVRKLSEYVDKKDFKSLWNTILEDYSSRHENFIRFADHLNLQAIKSMITSSNSQMPDHYVTDSEMYMIEDIERMNISILNECAKVKPGLVREYIHNQLREDLLQIRNVSHSEDIALTKKTDLSLSEIGGLVKEKTLSNVLLYLKFNDSLKEPVLTSDNLEEIRKIISDLKNKIELIEDASGPEAFDIYATEREIKLLQDYLNKK